jgi:RNA polymerase sigma factor (sigma-70 family)
MNGTISADAASSVPRWQAALAGVSLSVLSVVVILPVAASILMLWALVLAVAGGGALDAIGALRDRTAMADAGAITVTLLGMTGCVAAVGSISSRLGGATTRSPAAPGIAAPPPGMPIPGHAPPTPFARTMRARWYLRHPWLALGLFAFSVDGSLVPLQASHAIALPRPLLASQILTGAALLFLFATVLMFRGWWLGMRTLWAGVRRSSFFAGTVMTGSLIATLIALLLGHALNRAAGALPPDETARALQSCSGSVLDCSRELVHRATAGNGRQAASLPPAAAAYPEPPSSFDSCIETLHRPMTDGLSARDEAVRWVLLTLRDAYAAEDIVHSALISVCLGSEHIADLRPYFFKSVQNGIAHEARGRRRWCPLVPDEPHAPPEGCVIDSVLNGYIKAEMEASAYAALCSLSADERQVIQLHLWDNLSHADVARKLRCSEQAARQRYSRALRSLKDKFSERCR